MPNSEAISVNGITYRFTSVLSGIVGLNFASATTIPPGRSSWKLKSIVSWSKAIKISKSSEIARTSVVLTRILLFVYCLLYVMRSGGNRIGNILIGLMQYRRFLLYFQFLHLVGIQLSMKVD